jgi:hypothetical protein
VRNLSIEQLIFLLLFLLVPLFNLVARWLKRRTGAGAPPPEEAVAEPEPPPRRLPPRIVLAEPVETPPPMLPSPPPPPRPAARPAPPPVPSRRRPLLGLRGPEDVGRAVVLMAVLGPCRGLELHGADGDRLDR